MNRAQGWEAIGLGGCCGQWARPRRATSARGADRSGTQHTTINRPRPPTSTSLIRLASNDRNTLTPQLGRACSAGASNPKRGTGQPPRLTLALPSPAHTPTNKTPTRASHRYRARQSRRRLQLRPSRRAGGRSTFWWRGPGEGPVELGPLRTRGLTQRPGLRGRQGRSRRGGRSRQGELVQQVGVRVQVRVAVAVDYSVARVLSLQPKPRPSLRLRTLLSQTQSTSPPPRPTRHPYKPQRARAASSGDKSPRATRPNPAGSARRVPPSRPPRHPVRSARRPALRRWSGRPSCQCRRRPRRIRTAENRA